MWIILMDSFVSEFINSVKDIFKALNGAKLKIQIAN